MFKPEVEVVIFFRKQNKSKTKENTTKKINKNMKTKAKNETLKTRGNTKQKIRHFQ